MLELGLLVIRNLLTPFQFITEATPVTARTPIFDRSIFMISISQEAIDAGGS
jgi:hypothetical protein